MANALNVKIGGDIKELENALGRASRAIQDTGKRMTAMGKTLTTRITAPLTALAGVAVRSFGIQEKAELQLRAALQANGREVDNLFNRYNAFAQEMQRTTVIGDETTLSMLAQAESFGLSADNAERAVKNSIAMQSAFGVNAQSALRYTAALEEGNATMLTRYIPSLREITDEGERVAEAQRILGNAFSSAEAEAQGSTGQMIQMKNALGDLMEVVGGVIAEAIMPLVKRVKEMAEVLQMADKETIKMVVGIGALAAALGPALIIIGKLIIAIGALLSPIGLVIIGLVALATTILYVWDNWKAIIERISDISWWINAIISMTQFLIKHSPISLMIDQFNNLLKFFGGNEIPNPFDNINKELEKLKVDTNEYEHEFGSLMDAIKSGGQVAQNALMRLFSSVSTDAQKATEATSKAFRSMESPIDNIIDTTDELGRSLVGMSEFADGSIGRMNEQIAQLRNMMLSATNPAHIQMYIQQIEALEQKIKGLTETSQEMSNASVFAQQVANDFTNSFGAGMANVIVQGEKLVDVLKNIGKLLLSSAIQKGLSALLTGGLGGAGFFGSGGGLFGKLFSANDALITSGGDVVKFHPDDNILAMKDFSNLQMGGGSQRVEVFGTLKGQDLFVSSNRGGETYGR